MLPSSRGIRRLIVVVIALFGSVDVARGESDLQADFNKAEALQREGKFAEAAALLKGAVDRVRRAVPAGDPELANALAGYGYACSLANQNSPAEAALREALEIARTGPPEIAGLRLSVRNNLAEVLVKEGKAAEAIGLCEESVKETEKTYGSRDHRTHLARETMAKVYLNAKRPADAIAPARAALEAAEAASRPDDPETIPFRHTLCLALMQAGQLDDVEKLLKQSQAIVAKLPPGHEYATATANDLAAFYQMTDRPGEAAAASAKAVGGGPGGPSDNPVNISNQAVIKMQAGQYDDADDLFQKALSLARRTLGDEHPDTTAINGNLAHLNVLRGRYAAAERYARPALDAARKNPGRGTVAEAKAEITLAGIYYKTGRLDDALPLMTSAMKTMTDQVGADHPDTISTRQDLAALEAAMGHSGDAIADGEAAWAALEKKGTTNTPRAGLVLANLGQSYLMLGRLTEAKERLTRAVDVFQKLGRPSADSAIADNVLAMYHGVVGNLPEAETLSRRAAKTMELALGRDHPDTCNALDNLATRYACAGNWQAAADQFDETRRLRRGFLQRTLPALSEDDQIRLLDIGERISRDGALSLALLHREDPGLAARSAEWVLNAKGLALAALAERSLAAREPGNPEAVALRTERDRARDRLAMLALPRAESKPDEGGSPASTRAEYETLAERERELSRRLGPALPSSTQMSAWVTLDQVRAALPADGVLVEFVRVYLMEFPANILKLPPPSLHYAAWVIPPAGRGDVKLVDLGSVAALDRAVADALRAIRPGTANEGDGERVAHAALAVLARLIVTPLGPLVGSAHRWILSPDAALWLVPWSALPTGENRYAVEDHLIHLLTSGRELIPTATPSITPDAPAIFADPDYATDTASVEAEARKQVRERAGAALAATPKGQRSTGLPSEVVRLPGTRAEASAVTPLMETYAGKAPRVFLDKAASETIFKSLRGPRALLMSTHGLFLEAPDPTADVRARALRLASPMGFDAARSSGAVVNPLLRGSLVMAGYNSRNPALLDAGTDDGLLTGLEVVGVDLRGTDLVVLSACETALGEAVGGEGVAGLRQAFQLAGAGSVIATLWKVDDLETSQLIAALFEGLAARRSTARALREAQLALIADRRARLGAAHPYFWAAFTLTGDPGKTWRDEPTGPPGISDLPALPRTIEAGLKSDGTRGLPVSPLTGLPDVRRPWADLLLAAMLLAGGGCTAWRWWTRPIHGSGTLRSP